MSGRARKPSAAAPEKGTRALYGKGVIFQAALVFIEHGARAAHEFLGGSLRAKELLPKVFAKAKYIDRRSKE